MKKFILTLLLIGCSHSPSLAPPPTAPTPAVDPAGNIVSVTPLGHIGFRCEECTPEEVKKLQEAEKVVNEIVRGDCYGNFILRRRMIDTDKTSEEVLKHIRGTTLTVPIQYYYSWKNTVGYTYAGQPEIYFNRKYHDHYNACDTASNGLHEWTHKLGYTHAFKATADRGYSVPYTQNAAVEACCVSANGFRGDKVETVLENQ